MLWEPSACPACGRDAAGTFESLRGLALLDRQADGSYEYGGETKVWWDEQRTIKDAQGRVTLVCDEDHQWKALPL